MIITTYDIIAMEYGSTNYKDIDASGALEVWRTTSSRWWEGSCFSVSFSGWRGGDYILK
jgi:hypothetical protein